MPEPETDFDIALRQLKNSVRKEIEPFVLPVIHRLNALLLWVHARLTQLFKT